MKISSIEVHGDFEIKDDITVKCKFWFRSTGELVINHDIVQFKDKNWKELGWGPVHKLIVSQLEETEDYKIFKKDAIKFLKA